MTKDATATKDKIEAMWTRAEDRIESAVQYAPNWEREKAARSFQSGFYFALALMARERRLRER